jgi:hypothetical protein
MWSSSMNVRISVLAVALFATAAASAQQPTGTVQEIVEGLLVMSGSKCVRRGSLASDYERAGKPLEADAARKAEVMICDCMPSRLRQLRAALSQEELASRVTEAEFAARYHPRFLAACAGEGIRLAYEEGCEILTARVKPNPARYCQCMKREVASFTDIEAMELAGETADWVPLAAEAKKQGKAMPAQPLQLSRITKMDAACSLE